VLKIIYKKMNKSFKLYFLDINNIILDEKVEINNDDELKIEIKEKFEFIESIINNFIENHILVDIEDEEKNLVKMTSFIYQIEKGVMKTYKFFLFRKIMDEIFNIEVDAFFVVVDLEKDSSKLLKTIIDEIIKGTNIKFYILGFYKSKSDIKISKEKLEDLFEDKEQIEYKYSEINNNEEKDEIQQKIDKFIEQAMLDIYLTEKEGNGNLKNDKNQIDKAASKCIIM
jgi:hypothetical protein